MQSSHKVLRTLLHFYVHSGQAPPRQLSHDAPPTSSTWMLSRRCRRKVGILDLQHKITASIEESDPSWCRLFVSKITENHQVALILWKLMSLERKKEDGVILWGFIRQYAKTTAQRLSGAQIKGFGSIVSVSTTNVSVISCWNWFSILLLYENGKINLSDTTVQKLLPTFIWQVSSHSLKWYIYTLKALRFEFILWVFRQIWTLIV